ncbi:DUF4190 domain-containing protein [Actinomadura alba]|uniref:DUF4190 domain-containing protein n=1 Tax=Actinomadura alba TaxID=406431 RepID=A0ABR7LIS1_9ACTN|nr:DUF4190 domain-containing protein [Actinomadura alba]MBC6464655.1 DUF4190 domain-containing protein [Actinomadura alba]
MSEDPARKAGAPARQGAGNSTAPPEQDASERSEFGSMPTPPGVPGQPRPADRGGWQALWLGVLAALLTVFFAPLGLVAAIAALVIGVRARRRAKRNSGTAPGAIAGIVLGGIGLAFSAFSLVLTVILWPEMSGYQECLGKANTNSDKQTCRQEWFPRIENKLNLPEGSMSRYGDLL